MITGIESTRRVYIGATKTVGTPTVVIGGKELLPDYSQKVYNHSPDGFAWGYGGSGPAQLALAILLLYAEKDKAFEFHQQFKHEIIAGLEGDFKLTKHDVESWIWGKKIVICKVCGNGADQLSEKLCNNCWSLRKVIEANLEHTKEIIKLLEEEGQ